MKELCGIIRGGKVLTEFSEGTEMETGIRSEV